VESGKRVAPSAHVRQGEPEIAAEALSVDRLGSWLSVKRPRGRAPLLAELRTSCLQRSSGRPPAGEGVAVAPL
jgi:hypothetical protein